MAVIGSTRYAVLENTQRRDVEVHLSYGVDDVESLAEGLGVLISGEETQAILESVDSQLVALVGSSTQDAVRSKIAEQLRIVEHAHAESDDD